VTHSTGVSETALYYAAVRSSHSRPAASPISEARCLSKSQPPPQEDPTQSGSTLLSSVEMQIDCCLLNTAQYSSRNYRPLPHHRTRSGGRFFSRDGLFCHSGWFTVTRYSFQSRSSWSTEPLIYASNRFQFIGPKWTSAHTGEQPPITPQIILNWPVRAFWPHDVQRTLGM